MHAVLDTKAGSIYNDEISSLYHFPNRYKKIVDECVGDWVIFREPRDDGGRMAYNVGRSYAETFTKYY